MSGNYDYTYWSQDYDYYDSECAVMSTILGVCGCVGSIVNLFILSVLMYKMSHGGKKTSLDLFFAVLTLTDFLGCSILFVAKHFFQFGNCHYYYQTWLMMINLFLRTVSILVLDSIAVNRFLIIWKPTQTMITFRRSCFVTLIVLLFSSLVVAVFMFLPTSDHHKFLTAYSCFTFVNVLLIVVIYSAVCYQFCQTMSLTKQKQKLEKEQSSNYNLPTTSTVTKTRTRLMEHVVYRPVVVSIVVTLIYVICFLPEGILESIFIWNFELLLKYHSFYIAAEYYFRVFYNVNFLIMPFAYAILSHDFRGESINFVRHARKKIMLMTSQRSKNDQPTRAGTNTQRTLVSENTSTVNETDVL